MLTQSILFVLFCTFIAVAVAVARAFEYQRTIAQHTDERAKAQRRQTEWLIKSMVVDAVRDRAQGYISEAQNRLGGHSNSMIANREDLPFAVPDAVRGLSQQDMLAML